MSFNCGVGIFIEMLKGVGNIFFFLFKMNFVFFLEYLEIDFVIF